MQPCSYTAQLLDAGPARRQVVVVVVICSRPPGQGRQGDEES
jgi:hypothetical protein